MTDQGEVSSTAASAQNGTRSTSQGGVEGSVTVRAPVSANGTFTMQLDATATYTLYSEPVAGNDIPRLPLGQITPATVGNTLSTTLYFPRLKQVQGQVSIPAGNITDSSNQPPSRVQVFCEGARTGCIDTTTDTDTRRLKPTVQGLAPIVETVTDAQGIWRVRVPEPAEFVW